MGLHLLGTCLRSAKTLSLWSVWISLLYELSLALVSLYRMLDTVVNEILQCNFMFMNL